MIKSVKKFPSFLLLSFLFLALIISLAWPSNSLAQVRPFGGKILYTDWCTCTGNKLILYRPVLASMPKLLSYRPGASRLYSYYDLGVGMEILGTTASPDICLTGSHCHPHPLVAAMGLPWLISIVGTSDWGHQASSGSGGATSGGSGNTNPQPNNPNPQPATSGEPCTGDANRLASSYIMANEGWINSCQNDYCTDGQIRPMVGVGHDLTGSETVTYCRAPLSDSQVRTLFDQDYNKYRKQAQTTATTHGVNWNQLSPERQTVLTDMTFNMGAEGGGGLAGFDKMWGNIKQAQRTGQQQYWDQAGDEIMDSSGYGQIAMLKPRAGRNASVMRTNDQKLLNEKINSNARARTNCSGQ